MQGFIELVYDSLCAQLVEPLEGVEDAFEEGSICDIRYREMWAAYERLCRRLNVRNTDDVVEDIIHALLDIQRVLCRKMYLYGAKFGIR